MYDEHLYPQRRFPHGPSDPALISLETASFLHDLRQTKEQARADLDAQRLALENMQAQMDEFRRVTFQREVACPPQVGPEAPSRAAYRMACESPLARATARWQSMNPRQPAPFRPRALDPLQNCAPVKAARDVAKAAPRIPTPSLEAQRYANLVQALQAMDLRQVDEWVRKLRDEEALDTLHFESSNDSMMARGTQGAHSADVVIRAVERANPATFYTSAPVAFSRRSARAAVGVSAARDALKLKYEQVRGQLGLTDTDRRRIREAGLEKEWAALKALDPEVHVPDCVEGSASPEIGPTVYTHATSTTREAVTTATSEGPWSSVMPELEAVGHAGAGASDAPGGGAGVSVSALRNSEAHVNELMEKLQKNSVHDVLSAHSDSERPGSCASLEEMANERYLDAKLGELERLMGQRPRPATVGAGGAQRKSSGKRTAPKKREPSAAEKYRRQAHALAVQREPHPASALRGGDLCFPAPARAAPVVSAAPAAPAAPAYSYGRKKKARKPKTARGGTTLHLREWQRQVSALTSEVQGLLGVAPGGGDADPPPAGAAPPAARPPAGQDALLTWVGADVPHSAAVATAAASTSTSDGTADPYWNRWYAEPEVWKGFPRGDPTLAQLDSRVEELKVELATKGVDVAAL